DPPSLHSFPTRRSSDLGVRVIFHDILPNLSDEFATQVSLDELKNEADVVSLHLPLTPETLFMIDEKFISEMKKDFYFINTARGKNVKTKDLVVALKSGKIKAAALDVLEYERSSFESLDEMNEDLQFLLQSEKALVTPHIAGWSHQSKEKMAQIIVDKILKKFRKLYLLLIFLYRKFGNGKLLHFFFVVLQFAYNFGLVFLEK